MRPAPASFPPLIALDPASATPLYRQLFDWFRAAILAGRLKPGQRVPSSRQLAAELKLSRIPVLAAYEQLYAEGYLETFTGAGTCVARAIPDESLRPKDPGKAPETKGRGARRIAKRAAAVAAPERPWLTNMGAFRVGLPAVERLPHSTWARLVNRHVRHPPKSMLAYGDAMGHLPFREAIAEYLSLFRAVRCEAAQILVTTGSQQGLQIAAQVLLDPGAKVWMEEPGYPGAHQALKVAGMQLVPVPVDEEGLDVAAGLRRGREVRAAYITPSHQFPLGVTMSAARRLQLLNWATRQGA